MTLAPVSEKQPPLSWIVFYGLGPWREVLGVMQLVILVLKVGHVVVEALGVLRDEVKRDRGFRKLSAAPTFLAIGLYLRLKLASDMRLGVGDHCQRSRKAVGVVHRGKATCGRSEEDRFSAQL